MLLFVAAVTVSSWYGGLLGGVLATGLSAFLWTLLVVPPTLSLSLGEFADILRLTLFSLLAMLITGLNAARIRSEKDQLHIQHRLNLALELGGIGVWDYEVTKGTLWVSEGLSTILRASHPIDQFGKLVAIIHPEDRRILFDIISSPPEDQTSREITFRVVGKDSVSRRVNGRVECFVNRAGDIVRVVGVLEEVPGE